MSERIALGCLDCDFTATINTPTNQTMLRELVEEYKICKECGSKRIIQTVSVDDYGTFKTYN